MLFLGSRALPVLLLLLVSGLAGQAQTRGRLTGVVSNAAKAPVAGVAVVVTDQVTSNSWQLRSGSDGHFVLRLRPGAYRITVASTYSAKFEKDKNSPFTEVRGDALESVIIEEGKDTTVNIQVEEKKPVVLGKEGQDEPLGHAGKESIESEPQTLPDRREVRDRWRIGFPEYDRYGDRSGRGRDIPFKRGRWWDPYNQSVLKGDYPIRGNKLFMILSAVSTTTVEQRRAPTPSDVSSDE